MAPVTVLIADASPIVRLGIQAYFEKETQDISVVGVAGAVQETLDKVRLLGPDVLLLDLDLPGLDFNGIIRKCNRENNPTRILVMSTSAEARYLRELVQLGVFGYLLKDELFEIVVEAVMGAARGESGWFSRTVAAKLPSILREVNAQVVLTRREMQIMSRVIAGKTNREIAYELEIAEKTVEKHLLSIYTRLGVASRLEAALRVIKEGWMKISPF